MAINCSNCYISTGLNNIPITNSPKTIMMWVKNSDFTSTTRNWLSVVYGTVSAHQFGCRQDGLIGVWNYGGQYIVSSTAPAINTWFHMVYTFDGNKTHNLYINGVLINSNTNFTLTSWAINAIQLGGDQWNEFLSGYMEDIRIYNRVLSLTEITSIYKTRGVDGIIYGLVSWWDCCGVSGASVTTVIDKSISSNDGTVTTGAPTWDGTYIKLIAPY